MTTGVILAASMILAIVVIAIGHESRLNQPDQLFKIQSDQERN